MNQHVRQGQGKGRSNPLAVALAERDRQIVRTVERAVRDKNVRLAYQPIVSARDPSRPAFHEALVRVLDKDGRVIPAREFISEIEMTEVGRIVDCLSLELGLEALAANPKLKLSINLSARSIGYRRWLQTLDHGLARAPEAARRLVLEITEESAMVMPDVVQAFMNDLQARGISFALDDFGAGNTSFRYLKSFSFDILKIDGQFVRNIHEDPDNQVLLQALVDIGRHFDMFTVAETVQTRAEADFLTAIGVDCLQGYLFGAPAARPMQRIKPLDAAGSDDERAAETA